MTLTESLLERILAYCAAQNMTERQFGLTVANNHKLISRLLAGFSANSQTHDRIVAFIEAGNAAAAQAAAPASANIPKPKGKRSRAHAPATTPTSSAEAA